MTTLKNEELPPQTSLVKFFSSEKYKSYYKFYEITLQETLWTIRKFNRFIINFMLGDLFFFLSLFTCFIFCNIQTFTSSYPLNNQFKSKHSFHRSKTLKNFFDLLRQRDPVLMRVNDIQQLDFYENLLQLKKDGITTNLWFPPNIFFDYQVQACNNLLTQPI